jgi:predicted alpha/beta hydrolase
VVSLASVDDYDYAVAIHPSIDPSSGELVLLQALSIVVVGGRRLAVAAPPDGVGQPVAARLVGG